MKLSKEAVIEKLNGKTATALLNERSKPTYKETGTGNQFSCTVELLNYEKQLYEFAGMGHGSGYTYLSQFNSVLKILVNP